MLIMVPVGGLWYSAVNRSLRNNRNATKIIETGLVSQGITFMDQIILYRDGDEVKIFSASCTHLGCQLHSIIDGRLVCPCHGSAYDPSTGKVLSGPSISDLKRLEYDRIDDKFVVALP